jgi:hypothetical protein
MSNTRFGIMIALVGCPMAAAGVFFEMPLLMVLGIMIAPIAFAFRGKPASDSRQRGLNHALSLGRSAKK